MHLDEWVIRNVWIRSHAELHEFYIKPNVVYAYYKDKKYKLVFYHVISLKHAKYKSIRWCTEPVWTGVRSMIGDVFKIQKQSLSTSNNNHVLNMNCDISMMVQGN